MTRKAATGWRTTRPVSGERVAGSRWPRARSVSFPGRYYRIAALVYSRGDPDMGFPYRSTWTGHTPKAIIRAGRSRTARRRRSALKGAGGEGRPPELTAGPNTRRWAMVWNLWIARAG